MVCSIASFKGKEPIAPIWKQLAVPYSCHIANAVSIIPDQLNLMYLMYFPKNVLYLHYFQWVFSFPLYYRWFDFLVFFFQICPYWRLVRYGTACKRERVGEFSVLEFLLDTGCTNCRKLSHNFCNDVFFHI